MEYGKKVSIWLILYILCGLVFAPSVCIGAASGGVELCLSVVVPSLLPFFICSKMLVQNGFARYISKPMQFIMRPVFNVPGCGAFAMVVGALSGCPVGAKTVTELLKDGLCSKSEAQRMVCFCNNSGPLFIMGAVASGMLGYEKIGGLLYASHIISALLVGVCMSFYKRGDVLVRASATKRDERATLSSVMAESVSLMGYVCGFVIFFAVVVAILRQSGMIDIIGGKAADKSGLAGIIYGAFEMTNGIAALGAEKITASTLCAASFILGFGGLSAILQVRGIISEYGLSSLVFAAAKLAQGAISAFVTWVMLGFCDISLPVFATKSEVGFASLWANGINLTALFGIIILILSILSVTCKKVRRM